MMYKVSVFLKRQKRSLGGAVQLSNVNVGAQKLPWSRQKPHIEEKDISQLDTDGEI